MGTIKPHSNGPLYSNTVIGTLDVDGWAVTFGTAKKLETFALTVSQQLPFDQRSCATSDPVSTWMGDRLWTGKPFRYVTSQLGQLSLSSLRGR